MLPAAPISTRRAALGLLLRGIAALGNPKLVHVAFDAGFAVSRGRQ
jgi:hypothetical protein